MRGQRRYPRAFSPRSIVPYAERFSEVIDFDDHIRYMEGFHKRYIASEKVCMLWAEMVKRLDIEMIVPQHGHRYFKGKTMVNRFINLSACALHADRLK